MGKFAHFVSGIKWVKILVVMGSGFDQFDRKASPQITYSLSKT